MSKRIRVLIPDDPAERPRAIALEATSHPLPGRVFDVVGAASASAAANLIGVSLRESPDPDQSPQAFVAWHKARKCVSEVTRG